MCTSFQDKGLLGRSVELRKQGDESYMCCDIPGLAPRQISAHLATTLDLYGKVLQWPAHRYGHGLWLPVYTNLIGRPRSGLPQDPKQPGPKDGMFKKIA